MHSFLNRLGFSPEDKVIIFHGDDLGMCHAMNSAFMEIASVAPTACGSVMVTCPWFNEIVGFAQNHPEADIGVHITLTSEWQNYRWRPISTLDPKSGLLDEEGYLWADVESLHSHMDPDAAIAEMKAQVEYALNAGIDVTHIDTHMGAVVHPALFPAYVELGLTYRVPVMLPRPSEELISRHGIPPETVETLQNLLERLERTQDLPIIDHLASLYDVPPARREAEYRKTVESLPPGLTHFIYHAAMPGAEIEAISPKEDREGRIADYRAFSHPDIWEWLKAHRVHIIGYRTLRDAMKA